MRQDLDNTGRTPRSRPYAMVEHVVPPPHRATGVSTRHALRRRLDLLQSRRSLNGRASLFWASLVGFSGDQPHFGEEASSSDLSLGLFNLVTPRLCINSDFHICSLVPVTYERRTFSLQLLSPRFSQYASFAEKASRHCRLGRACYRYRLVRRFWWCTLWVCIVPPMSVACTLTVSS